jgi:uncharacterized protein (TIRG00374 family)
LHKFKFREQRWYISLRRVLRWAIPITVLYFVIQSIDFAKFKTSVAGTNPWLVALGLCLAPLLISIAALRWRFLLGQYHKLPIPFHFGFKHYWIGLALGFFSPASLGLDAYRVVVSGRHHGGYTINTAIILVEKLMAFVNCMFLIVVLYPVVPISSSPVAERIFLLAYILFFVSVLLIVLIVFALRNQLLSLMLERVERFFWRILDKIWARMALSGKAKMTKISLRTAIEPLSHFKILGTIVLSFGIQLISAVKSQIFFFALGYDLPFIVNLFVTPTLYFIFLLPVSFGSIGIREGVYIVLYGLFGVPAEVALLVSFFNLSGMLLNNAIGGLVMLFSGKAEELYHKAPT